MDLDEQRRTKRRPAFEEIHRGADPIEAIERGVWLPARGPRGFDSVIGATGEWRHLESGEAKRPFQQQVVVGGQQQWTEAFASEPRQRAVSIPNDAEIVGHDPLEIFIGRFPGHDRRLAESHRVEEQRFAAVARTQLAVENVWFHRGELHRIVLRVEGTCRQERVLAGVDPLPKISARTPHSFERCQERFERTDDPVVDVEVALGQFVDDGLRENLVLVFELEGSLETEAEVLGRHVLLIHVLHHRHETCKQARNEPLCRIALAVAREAGADEEHDLTGEDAVYQLLVLVDGELHHSRIRSRSRARTVCTQASQSGLGRAPSLSANDAAITGKSARCAFCRTLRNPSQKRAGSSEASRSGAAWRAATTWKISRANSSRSSAVAGCCCCAARARNATSPNASSTRSRSMSGAPVCSSRSRAWR